MKIALVHDWLYTYGGAEKVLEQILECFPHADIFSLIDFLPIENRAFLRGKQVRTSFLQKLPFAKTRHRLYLPFMPLAIEQFDLSSYDLVISSSHAVAKGVLIRPGQLHICYCHSPIRYAWDMQHQYLQEAGLTSGVKSWLTRYLLHKIRLWDYRTANGVDYFIANSSFIAKRIYKTYRREATVIYPPVDTSKFAMLKSNKEDYYLTTSRLVPYKKILLIVEAFAKMPDRRLKVAGEGPDLAKIQAIIANNNNIEYLGYVKDAALVSLMQKAQAFVFAAEEDFGIVPVEAQACGTPVIAFARGGALETVITKGDFLTGVFFKQQTIEDIVKAVANFEINKSRIKPENCRNNAETFSIDKFKHKFKQFVLEKYNCYSESDID